MTNNGTVHRSEWDQLPLLFRQVIAEGWADCLNGKDWSKYKEYTDVNLQMAYEQGRYWAANAKLAGIPGHLIRLESEMVQAIVMSIEIVGNPLPFEFDKTTAERK